MGGLTGAAASIGAAVVTNSMQPRRERDARGNEEIDSAQLALKEISRQMTRYVLQPGWWPSLDWLDTPRDFAYDVVRLVPNQRAVDEWAAASQEILAANTSLWRLWLWHLVRFGMKDRQRMADRIIAAEVEMISAAESMRPGRPTPKREDKA